MEGLTFQVNIGAVRSRIGELKFSLAVDENGQGQVHVFAIDPTDLRKAGVLLTLDEDGLTQFDDLLEKVYEVAHQLKTDGRMKTLKRA
ncbi:hypothetical protein [Aquabacterium sp. A08]|uniref:hypothetical protein n=1 Tax=Aquabacterium sp. A08 TaxID=2718532 RepID=UPI00142401C8|nr:hypothetical protein [Aquabacterium sp. A08]NIC39770.1 hypothetical protein [Aquabacterium sp. A08]